MNGRSPGVPRESWGSENIPAEVLIPDDVCEHPLNIGGIDDESLLLQLATGEGDFIEQLLHQRVEAARANVFRSLVHFRSVARNGLQSIVGEAQVNTLSLHESHILVGERISR